MVLLFYVNDGQIFIPSKDKMDDLYASLQAYFKIEYDREIKQYLGMKLDHFPHGSIHIRNPYLTQSNINLIPGIEKSSDKMTPVANPHLAINE